MRNTPINRRAVTATATTLTAVGLTAFAVSRRSRDEQRAAEISDPPQDLGPDPDELSKDADEVAAGFRQAQQDMVAIFSTMTLAGLCCAALVGWVTAGLDPSTSWVFEAWKEGASGWLSPGDSLVVALSILAVIATINIAISVPMNVQLLPDQVALT